MCLSSTMLFNISLCKCFRVSVGISVGIFMV